MRYLLPREDSYFALVVGAGYNARLIGDASRELKNALGFAAYIVTYPATGQMHRWKNIIIDEDVMTLPFSTQLFPTS